MKKILLIFLSTILFLAGKDSFPQAFTVYRKSFWRWRAVARREYPFERTKPWNDN